MCGNLFALISVFFQVEEKINDLRGLFPGGDVSAAVSMAPQLLLYDVETCLRPRMTRLVVALTVNQLEGVLNATMVRVNPAVEAFKPGK